MTSLQDSYIAHHKKASWRHALSITSKLLLLVLLTGYIITEVFRNEEIGWQFRQLADDLLIKGWNWIYLILVLMVPLNWFLESFKWQILLRPVTSISLMGAFKGVLTGLALGFMTPHSLGDYAGRIGQLGSSNRLESMGAILLGRGAQFLSTLLFGLLGLWAWYRVDSTGLGLGIFWTSLFILGLLLLLFFFARSYFVLLCQKLWPPVVRFVKVLSQYSRRQVLGIFALSLLRYLVFSSQFLILLYWLDTPLPVSTLMAGVSWVLLAKSVIPAFNFLSDLGVREFSALYFFGLYAISPAPVLTASLSIWLLNILVPTLIGAGFIIQMKIFSN